MGYKCHILFIACKDFSTEEGENIKVCLPKYCRFTAIVQVGLVKLYCSICQYIAEIVNDFYFIFFFF